jgi:hypothetical protein
MAGLGGCLAAFWPAAAARHRSGSRTEWRASHEIPELVAVVSALLYKHGMKPSPRIPDDASEEDLDELVAQVLDAAFEGDWYELSVTPPEGPET